MVIEDQTLALIVNLIIITGMSVLNCMCNFGRYQYQLVKAEGIAIKQRKAAVSFYTRCIVGFVFYIIIVAALLHFGPV